MGPKFIKQIVNWTKYLVNASFAFITKYLCILLGIHTTTIFLRYAKKFWVRLVSDDDQLGMADCHLLKTFT